MSGEDMTLEEAQRLWNAWLNIAQRSDGPETITVSRSELRRLMNAGRVRNNALRDEMLEAWLHER